MMEFENDKPNDDICREANLPTVAVIVPAYNEVETIDTCLQALKSQTYPDERTCTFVVDNCSDDGTRTRAESYDVNVLEQSKQGSYAARNEGIRATEAEILAFTDADGRPTDEWLERAVTRVRAGADVVTGPIDSRSQRTSGSAPELYDRLFGFDTRTVKTANLVARASVFEDVGLFRSELTSGGDVEWGQRAQRNGYTVKYAEDVVVHHPPRRTYRTLVGKTIRTGYGSGQKKRMSCEPMSVWSMVRFLLAEPIRFLTWFGWRLKCLLHEIRTIKLPPTTVVKLSAVIPLLAVATTYGRVRGFIQGPDGRKVGDYGAW